MEKESKKPIIDVTIRKFFEIKVKQGVEIKKAHIDESKYYKNIYFLQDKHLNIINMSTKKIQKCEILKGEEVIYITSNSNNNEAASGTSAFIASAIWSKLACPPPTAVITARCRGVKSSSGFWGESSFFSKKRLSSPKRSCCGI